MIEDIQTIVEENKRRNEKFEKIYNPASGEGSLIEREKVFIAGLGELYLPVEMLNKSDLANILCEQGNIFEFARLSNSTPKAVAHAFTEERFKYDFEFWAIKTITIWHKTEFTPIAFKLRLPQQFLLVELEKLRLAGVPILIILLKARQWGGSTLVQMYMFWIQQVHRQNWHLAVCAQDDGAASNISEMYRRAAASYPDQFGKVSFKPYARSPKNVQAVQRGGIIGVGSINNPDQFRSYNYAMIHFSEPGIWEDTPKRTAKQLVTSLRSILPDVPYSMEVLESTAKGIGSFFHNEWIDAVNGKSGYTPVFVPWHHIDMYRKKINIDIKKFVNEMDEYDDFLWQEGATLEGINWYHNHKVKKNYDDWMMFNEFPTTAQEAFISSGTRYFSPKIVEPQKTNIIDPKFVGQIHPANPKNKKDIELSHFVKSPKGKLKIWNMPRNIVRIKGELYEVKNRYCAFGDIGGTSKGADFSSLSIMDRYWMLFGGFPEIALDWHGHLMQDQFAWEAAQICFLYGKCLLAIETNSLKKEKEGTEGDHFFTILDTIKDHYDNLFIRNEVEKINKDWQPKYGFHTGAGSKTMILSSLRAGLRESEYIEKDFEAIREYEYYEMKDDGSFGAVEGQHDDRVISRAGAYWLATSYAGMPPVKLVPYLTDEEKKKKRKSKNKIISEASL